jgi:hypothetical protein
MRSRDAHAAADRHLLGIGTAIAVFLVLLLVKLGAFFIVHAGMVIRFAPSDSAVLSTASGAMREK